ncbi:hypothetical protein G5B10_01660 [Fluviicola sp. SGL-29]|nr:hypothetical protein [Fluviicola sp. SGL-29]
MRFQLTFGLLLLCATEATSQTLYVPGSTSGIGGSSNANVGIGVSSPAEKLHINGAVRGNAGGGALRINSGNGYIDVGAQNTLWGHIYTDRPGFVFNKPVQVIGGVFAGFGSSDLSLQTGGVNRITISGSTGVITTFSDVVTEGAIKVKKGNNRWISLGDGSTVSNFRISANEDIGNVYADFRSNLYFRNWDNVSWSPLVIESSGNVGIGFYTGYTSGKQHTQGYRLAVNGGILCEEVKVIVDVPNSDFVFEEDYELMSLDAVENYVKTHKHLPEVPSAQEFKENGYAIGQMDDLLLRKVEQLTLYVIEQNKKIAALEQQLREKE